MGKYILVVEDNMIIGLVTRKTLLSAGYEVHEIITSGAEAVKACQEQCPDLILMDIQLDYGEDGIETMRKIREFCSAPVIYLTGNSEMKSREKMMDDEEFSTFMIKPVQPRELLETVDEVLNGKLTQSH